MLVEVYIANRRKVVELRVLITRGFQFGLSFPQLAVLNLQFNLMHLQIVNQAPQLRFSVSFFLSDRRPGADAPSRKFCELSP